MAISVPFGPGVFQVCVNVSILEDETVENDEDFTLNLTSDDSVVLIGTGSAAVTILEDNDSMFCTHKTYHRDSQLV